VEDQEKALALGAEGYFVKPISRQQLIGKLDDLMMPATLSAPLVLSGAADYGVRSVLIVDDEESARYLLKRLMSELPVRVTEAASGVEGLRLAAEQRPEAIFLDLKMPGMSGWAVLDSLKSDPLTRDIPVIMISTETPLSGDQSKIDRAQGWIRKSELTAQALKKLLQGVDSVVWANPLEGR
jgi:CheY-like chemotaxis protein